jgi:hypothetical protein
LQALQLVKVVQEDEAPSLGPNWQQHNLAKLHASTHDVHITKLIKVFFNMPSLSSREY